MEGWISYQTMICLPRDPRHHLVDIAQLQVAQIWCETGAMARDPWVSLASVDGGNPIGTPLPMRLQSGFCLSFAAESACNALDQWNMSYVIIISRSGGETALTDGSKAPTTAFGRWASLASRKALVPITTF